VAPSYIKVKFSGVGQPVSIVKSADSEGEVTFKNKSPVILAIFNIYTNIGF
jgi:hypothetical protein